MPRPTYSTRNRGIRTSNQYGANNDINTVQQPQRQRSYGPVGFRSNGIMGGMQGGVRQGTGGAYTPQQQGGKDPRFEQYAQEQTIAQGWATIALKDRELGQGDRQHRADWNLKRDDTLFGHVNDWNQNMVTARGQTLDLQNNREDRGVTREQYFLDNFDPRGVGNFTGVDYGALGPNQAQVQNYVKAGYSSDNINALYNQGGGQPGPNGVGGVDAPPQQPGQQAEPRGVGAVDGGGQPVQQQVPNNAMPTGAGVRPPEQELFPINFPSNGNSMPQGTGPLPLEGPSQTPEELKKQMETTAKSVGDDRRKHYESLGIEPAGVEALVQRDVNSALSNLQGNWAINYSNQALNPQPGPVAAMGNPQQQPAVAMQPQQGKGVGAAQPINTTDEFIDNRYVDERGVPTMSRTRNPDYQPPQQAMQPQVQGQNQPVAQPQGNGISRMNDAGMNTNVPEGNYGFDPWNQNVVPGGKSAIEKTADAAVTNANANVIDAVTGGGRGGGEYKDITGGAAAILAQRYNYNLSGLDNNKIKMFTEGVNYALQNGSSMDEAVAQAAGGIQLQDNLTVGRQRHAAGEITDEELDEIENKAIEVEESRQNWVTDGANQAEQQQTQPPANTGTTPMGQERDATPATGGTAPATQQPQTGAGAAPTQPQQPATDATGGKKKGVSAAVDSKPVTTEERLKYKKINSKKARGHTLTADEQKFLSANGERIEARFRQDKVEDSRHQAYANNDLLFNRLIEERDLLIGKDKRTPEEDAKLKELNFYADEATRRREEKNLIPSWLR